MPAGQKLKNLRNQRNITVREVEQASPRIADAKRDKRFCISNGWLAQLENGIPEPSIPKLFSLSVIYHADFLDLVSLYHVDVDDKEKYEPVANPHLTQLISEKSNGNSGAQPLTNLIPNLEMFSARQGTEDDQQANIVYGYLGSADF